MPPQAPPGPPPGGAAVGGDPSRPPDVLVQQIAGVVGPIMAQLGVPPGAVGSMVADFLAFVANQAGPQAPQQLFYLLDQSRVPPQELAQLIVEFAQSPAGGGSAPPPPGMGVPSGPGPVGIPGGPPPGGPVPGGPPPAGPMGGPPPGSAPVGPGGPAPRPIPTRPKKDRKRKPVKAPTWEPPEAPESGYGAGGPTLAQVLEEAEEGRNYFRPLHEAIQEWRDIYHQVEEPLGLDNRPTDRYRGDTIVQRAQPVIMADRQIGLTAPDLERLGIQADPWDDTDEGREAAQTKENFCRYALDEAFRAWNRRATSGDFQPPLDRKVAGLATIEGGYAWHVVPDMDVDPERAFPWRVAPVSLMELYPRPRATTRQIECRLADAYIYDEVRALLPKAQPDDTDPLPYNDQSTVRLITHTDEVWWSLCLDFANPAIAEQVRERNGKRELWIYPPKRHNLGRRLFVLENPWNATPLGAYRDDRKDRQAFLARGTYAPIVGQIKFIDQLITAVRAGVFKDLNRPLKLKLDPTMRAANPDIFPADTRRLALAAQQAGGVVPLGPNEDIEPIVDALAASPNAQFLLQSAMGDLGDAAPPVLAGRGIAQSGFDRFQQNDSAGVLHIDPMQAYHTRQIALLLEVILTDLARLTDDKGKRKGGEGKTWKGLTYKVSRSQQRGGAYRSILTAKEIKRAGPYVQVTYKRLSMTERMQMAQLNIMMVKEHLKSRLSAMDEMGVDDTERENARIFAEAALEDPSVIKAAIKVALEKQIVGDDGSDELDIEAAMYDAYLEARDKEAQAEAEKGLPGMPSPTGGPPPPMPGSPAAGLPPTMGG